jgi:hypothetical protein
VGVITAAIIVSASRVAFTQAASGSSRPGRKLAPMEVGL